MRAVLFPVGEKRMIVDLEPADDGWLSTLQEQVEHYLERRGEIYTVLYGPILAVSYGPDDEIRDMTDDEIDKVCRYVGGPESGWQAVDDIKRGLYPRWRD